MKINKPQFDNDCHEILGHRNFYANWADCNALSRIKPSQKSFAFKK